MSRKLCQVRIFFFLFCKMSRQRGQTSVEVRKIIIEQHKNGKTMREIGKLVNRPRSTVCDTIKRFKETKSVENKVKTGRPKLFTDANERWIVNQVRANPHLSAPKLTTQVKEHLEIDCNPETLRLVLRKNNLNGRVARKKPYISKENKNKRINFAKTYKNKDIEFWKDVIFCDESKYNIFRSDGQSYVWRKPNEELKEKNLRATVKHGGGSVMVWGCMSASGPGNLCFVDGIMDHKQYLSILKRNLIQSAEKLGIKEQFCFTKTMTPSIRRLMFACG